MELTLGIRAAPQPARPGHLRFSSNYFSAVENSRALLAIDKLTNAGIMKGDVLLNGGNDVDIGTGGMVYGTIHGGDGDDRIKGSGNKDILLGQAGDDIMYAQDGYTDTVDCGPGDDDVAYVDARDSATADCETVLVARQS